MPKPDETFTFKDPTKLGRWAKGLLYAGVALSAIGLISGAMEYQLLNDMMAGAFESQAEMEQAANANDTRQGLIVVAQLILMVATAVAVLMWIYRANHNAHALGAIGMRFTPGWAVGWYFIPILNLWKPYQAMKEIWKASANPRDWPGQPRSPLLPWWWFFWILSGILGQILFRVSLAADEIDELMAASLLGVGVDAIDIPLDLLVITIIGGITRMQMAQAANQPAVAGPARGPVPEPGPGPESSPPPLPPLPAA